MTLKEWITERGLTQREAAERLDVHEITLNRWLNGHALPRTSKMRAIADATGGAVQPADFFAQPAAA